MSGYFPSDKVNLFKIHGSQPQKKKNIWGENTSIISKQKIKSRGPQEWNLPPNCFFQLQGILHLWVFMVCLHSAPVRVPSRVPSPQSPLVGTHTLHCHSPQSDFFTFFSGRKKGKTVNIWKILIPVTKFIPGQLNREVRAFYLLLHWPVNSSNLIDVSQMIEPMNDPEKEKGKLKEIEYELLLWARGCTISF